MSEQEIRRALEAEAALYPVPDGLAERTIEAARALPDPAFADRWRAYRDARDASGGVKGYPRWVYAGAAAAVLVAFFAIGRDRPSQTTAPGRGGTGSTVFSGGPDATPAIDTPARALAGLRDVRPTSPGSPDPASRSSSQAQSGSVRAENQADVQAGSGEVRVEQRTTTRSGDEIAGSTVTTQGPNPGTVPPKVVRNADVEIRVRDGRFDAAWATANEIASRHGGFVVESSTEQVGRRLARGSLTARVPADKLDAALAEFRRLGTLVRMSSSGTDASGQLVDLDARIRAAEAQELQTLELLKQAKTVSETLEIRTRLDAVRREVEQLKAQRDHLQGQVDYATLRATVYEPDAEPDRPRASGKLPRAWGTAGDAVVTILAGALIVGGYALPLAAIGLGLYALAALARRKRGA